MRIISDLLALFYPRVCLGCGQSLYRSEEIICLSCLHHLPKTHFEKQVDNPVSRIFWGRIHFEAATSGFFFRKGNLVQKLIHHLKYKGETQAGVFLGKQLGILIRDVEGFREARMILPVPLHPRKLRKRGYNQSDYIAEGLSISMGIPVRTDILTRKAFTDSQTKKSRYNRWINVEGQFHVRNPDEITYQHIILIDDVLTTGATLEASAQALLQAGALAVSVATIACAMR